MDGAALRVDVNGKSRVFCCHKAIFSGAHQPNSLDAVAECIAAGVPRLEIDVQFLADDGMLIFHDRRLDHETTAKGPTRDLTAGNARGVRYTGPGQPPLAFLDQVVDLVRGQGSQLQVDLKVMRPITSDRVRALADALAPVRGQVLIGCQAHWNLRPLAAAGYAIALDPSLHWHYAPGRAGAGLVPAREGLHGLWDDAPIAHISGVEAAAYVGTRIDDLVALAPQAVEWMVDVRTCLRLDELGVPLGQELAGRGIELAAWTIEDEGAAVTSALLRRLFGLGATTIITGSALSLAEYSAQLGVNLGKLSPSRYRLSPAMNVGLAVLCRD